MIVWSLYVIAAFKQQKDKAFYLSEQDVSTTNFDHEPHDRQNCPYLAQV
jgi:hypothetical protein